MRKNSTFLFFLIIISIALISSNTNGQKQQSSREAFLQAESFFFFEEYLDALPLYHKLIRENPYNDNINYRIGICYLHHPYRTGPSLIYLLKAVGNISDHYKEGSFKETSAPPDALFYLGEAYRVNGKLDEAITSYQKFLEQIDDKTYDRTLVQKKINSCNFAKEMVNNPVEITYVNVGIPVNSFFEENHPVISGDGKTLAFTRKLKFYDGIFVSYKKDGKWTGPQNIIPQLGVDGDVLTSSLNQNGTTLYLYKGDNYDGNIYISKFENGIWTTIKKLNENINTKYWEANASESSDGKKLYFSSNRPGGFGKLDIYVSDLDINGDWGVPVNLGSEINSPYNDDAGFVTNDQKRIFFSSFGHENMGGYDVFYAERDENNQWKKPVNLGYPLNSTKDDLFICPFQNGEYLYIALFMDDSYGLKDIYKVQPDRFFNKKETTTETQIISSDNADKETNALKSKEKSTSESVNIDEITQKDMKAEMKEPQDIEDQDYESGIHIVDTFKVPKNKSSVKDIFLKRKYFQVYSMDTIKLDIPAKNAVIVEIIHSVNDSVIKKYNANISGQFYKLQVLPENGKNIITVMLLDQVGAVITRDTLKIDCKLDTQLATRDQTETVMFNFSEFLEDFQRNADENISSAISFFDRGESITSFKVLMKKLNAYVQEFNYKESDIYQTLLKTLFADNIQTNTLHNLLITYCTPDQLIKLNNIKEKEIQDLRAWEYLVYLRQNILSLNEFLDVTDQLVINHYHSEGHKAEKNPAFVRNIIISLFGAFVLISVILLIARKKRKRS